MTSAVSLDPDPPLWADEFSVSVDQNITYKGVTYLNTFMYYYDAKDEVERTDHGKGQFDELCRSIKGKEFSDEECSFLVAKDGWRYLLFPNDNSCCRYCHADHGCGMIRKDWLHGSAYVGEMNVGGTLCDGW